MLLPSVHVCIHSSPVGGRVVAASGAGGYFQPHCASSLHVLALPVIQSTHHPRSPCFIPPSLPAGGRPGGVDDMVGRQVRITKGLHKGLIGTIKSATPTQYRVELNARGKTLPFPRDAVREEHANRHSIETGAVAGAGAGAGMGGAGAGGLYGAPGAATPAWIGGGGMTPALGLGGGMGAATPAYGLGGQTPFMGALMTSGCCCWCYCCWCYCCCCYCCWCLLYSRACWPTAVYLFPYFCQHRHHAHSHI